ncbi:MAG TPA: ATP-dependent RNA helicase RhlB [Aliiroseovarius sp.]|nr:ATP-dependent RNA helicase RhlB [Aliiroseovarius sp.]
MSERHLTDTSLASFDFPEALRQGIRETGFTHCTPIQAETLPLALKGVDVAGQAQTGTGKTAAYLLATLTRLLTHPPSPRRQPTQPRALILAPTRELAVQIHKDAEVLARHTGQRLGLVYGGTAYEQQRRQLEAGVDLLIGTPGRLIDYFKQKIFDLRAVEVLVIDEADRMFDLGFIKDIRYILRRLPKPDQRLNLLFSATLSWRVTELAYEHMNNPRMVKVEPDVVTGERIRECAYYPANEEKIPLLVGLLKSMDSSRTMVFVNTKRAAEAISLYLEANGLHAGLLSGDVPQKKRLKLLSEFENGTLPVLVATDVAARGLHIPDVTHVINFDLPQDPEDYVHRIGRTARAGASGDAISFVCESYAFSLPDIEAYIGHPIPVRAVTAELLPELVRPKQRPQRRGGGSRRARPRSSNGPPRRRRPPRSATNG